MYRKHSEVKYKHCWKLTAMLDFILALMSVLNRKEVKDMAVIYAQLVIKGKRKFSQVPARIQEQVKDILLDMDLENIDELLKE